MQNIRNIAIIAHVDHGKTTLVDRMLHQAKLFRENQETANLILDNNDLERERGITILSKNVSVNYKGTKINIIDTPGHSDFGGEVERVLNMADGVLLVVDAFEGPMPQTRFVLQKAIELKLKPIVVINKVDKPNCSPELTQEAVFDLMFNLGANEDQLDFPTAYGSSKQGWMNSDWNTPTEDISYLMDLIVEHIPAPKVEDGNTQMMISSLDYSSYIGRIAVGRLHRGSLQAGQDVMLVKRDGKQIRSKIKELYVFEGLGKERIKDPIEAGEITAVLLDLDKNVNFEIGDSICDIDNPEPLKPIKIDEPTMSMLFTINNSPFFGKEGKFVTSRHIRERLYKELEKNLAMRIEETDSPDSLIVFGRGILHLSILIETMRREGYEMMCSNPRVLFKEIDGVKCEPMERVTLDVPSEYVGAVVEKLGQRKGDLLEMNPLGSRMRIEYSIPSRCLFGYRSEFLTATRGEGIMNTIFDGYQPYRGEIVMRFTGSLVASEDGETTRYGLYNTQERGNLFVGPQTPVYEGMVVGETPKNEDISVNPCKKKQLTAIRSAGADEKLLLTPPVIFSLEEAIEFITDDELIEVTPKSIRIRKKILNTELRMKAVMKARREAAK